MHNAFSDEKGGDSVNNYAAMGYALLAADQMRLTKEQKEQLWKLMYSIMDIKTEEQAEERFMRDN